MRSPRPARVAAFLERVSAIALALWALGEGFRRGLLVFFIAAAADVSPGSDYDRGAATGKASLLWLLFMLPSLVALTALIWPVLRRTPPAWWKRPVSIAAIMGVVYVGEAAFLPGFRLVELIDALQSR